MERLEKVLQSKEFAFDKITEEIQSIGEGSLNLNYKAGKHYYIEYNGGKQKGISRNIDRVYELARKEYLERKLAVLAKEREVLKRNEADIALCRDSDIEEKIIKKYSQLDFDRIIYSEKELDWYRNRESQNPYMRENLIYATESGNLMRSKSERFIGDFIECKRRLYRYEPKIVIDGKMLYPDFMVLRQDGEVVIWEHLGLMDNAEYFNRTMLKLHEYRKAGFVQHHNLICTYEEDLRGKEVLEEIYHRFLL